MKKGITPSFFLFKTDRNGTRQLSDFLIFGSCGQKLENQSQNQGQIKLLVRFCINLGHQKTYIYQESNLTRR